MAKYSSHARILVSLILVVSYCSPYWPTSMWNGTSYLFVVFSWLIIAICGPKLFLGPPKSSTVVDTQALNWNTSAPNPFPWGLLSRHRMCVFSPINWRLKIFDPNDWKTNDDQFSWCIWWVVKLHPWYEPLAKERVWCLQPQCTGYTSRLLLGWCLPTLDDLGIPRLEETFPKLMPKFFWWSLTASYHCDTAWVHS